MNPEERFGKSSEKGVPTVKQMQMELERSGNWKVSDQKPDQDSIEIEGQKIALPLTNMSGLTAIFKKDSNNQWKYIGRGQGTDFEILLKMSYAELKSNQS